MFPLEGSIMDKILKDHKAIIIKDTSDENYYTNGLLLQENIHSRLCLPLFYGNEVIGGFFMESEEKFRKISSSAQDAIIMLDSAGRVSYWNEAAEEMFDYSKGKAIGKDLHELVIPERFFEAHLKGFKRFQERQGMAHTSEGQ